MKESALIGLCMAILFTAMLTGAASAAEPGRDAVLEKFLAGKNICDSIQSGINEGMDNQLLVKTAIEMGFNSCGIIKCAIAGGGDLEGIIKGASEAGVNTDVISKCALDAGAAAKDVANYLEGAGMPSICYFMPPRRDHDIPDDCENPPCFHVSNYNF